MNGVAALIHIDLDPYDPPSLCPNRGRVSSKVVASAKALHPIGGKPTDSKVAASLRTHSPDILAG